MTREKAIEELRKCHANTDIEMAHLDADHVLCQLLRELGYADVVAEWDKIYKWYA